MSENKDMKSPTRESISPSQDVEDAGTESLDLPVLTEASGVNEETQDMDLESFRSRWKAELEDSFRNPSEEDKSKFSMPSNFRNKGYAQQRKGNNPFAKKLDSVPESASPEDSCSNSRSDWKKKSNRRPDDDTNANDEPLSSNKSHRAALSEEEKEEAAQALFVKAVEFERSGKLYEAIQHYRKAMQLVPDIESKISQNILAESSDEESDSENPATPEHDGLTDNSRKGMWYPFTNLLDPSAPVCVPQIPIHGKSTHISSLPREILEHILLWLVGKDLDTRSLHSLSAVSKGFYMLTKCENLWRKACHRVWGVDCSLQHLSSVNEWMTGVQTLECYPSWREMFHLRPQPRYNGCYISKTSYFRSGECNFHDSNYQPWHLVNYYRLLRFFPGGVALMLTTSDAPQAAVNHLSSRHTKHSQVLVGTYSMDGPLLHLEFIRQYNSKVPSNMRGARNNRRRQVQPLSSDVQKTIMNITLELLPTRKGVRNWFQWWKKYIITNCMVNGTVSSTPIDVSQCDTFPQLSFSRVKSYSKECSEALE